jgi:hypothetical protein
VHFEFRNSRPRLLSALVVFIILCGRSVRAQSSPDGANRGELIQPLQKRIDELEASQRLMREKIEKIEMGTAAA